MLAEQELSIMGQAALAYAARGWPVVPLHAALELRGGEERARCTCGNRACKAPGKHPRTRHGITEASTDEAQIRTWWERWPGASIALATGAGSGLWVLDVDAKLPPNNGEEQVLSGIAALASLEVENGVLPDTLTSATGGGGRHLFFRWPDDREIKSRQGKIPGPAGQRTSLDVRGKGGYVVLPPSPHASGTAYRWLLERELANAPAWLLELVDPREGFLFDPMAYSEGPVTEEERQRRYGEGVLDGACRRIVGAAEGSRHETLNREAFIVGQYIAGGVINAAVARNALEQAGIAAGKPAGEVRRTVHDALQKGMAAEARQVPPPTRQAPAIERDDDDSVVEISEARTRKGLLRRLHRFADRRSKETGDLLMGLPKATLENAVRILRADPMFAGRLSFNRFSSRAYIDDAEVTDDALVQLRFDIDRAYRASFTHPMMDHAVSLVAHDKPVDPLRAYLEGLQWDGKHRLDGWLTDYLGAPRNELTHAYGVRWMVSAVARALEPGCKADLVLTLRGEQYAGKSRVCRILAVQDEWVLDEAIDIRSKDGAFSLEGRWIVELVELASVAKRDVETVKAFVTRQQDRVRRPYARTVSTLPRRCVFVATTNAHQFLNDPSGSRRFAVVDVAAAIDLEGLQRDRDQLWAETVEAHRQGCPWHLTREELGLQREENASYETEDPWAELVRDYLRKNIGREPTSSDVLKDAIGLDGRTMDRGSTMRLGHVMRTIGYERVRVRNGTVLEYRYKRLQTASDV